MLAEMFLSAAGWFEELSYFATLGTFVFKYGHHLLPLLKETYDMMNAPNNQQQIGHACKGDRMPRLPRPAGESKCRNFELVLWSFAGKIIGRK